MFLKSYFPLMVAAFVLGVGLFFGVSTFIELPSVDPAPESIFRLRLIAAAFTAVGGVFIVMFRRGRLKKRGKSVAQVRMEAVENLKSETLLADIALKDPHAQVRETAKKRLEELSG